jgi:hypothetical protein
VEGLNPVRTLLPPEGARVKVLSVAAVTGGVAAATVQVAEEPVTGFLPALVWNLFAKTAT